MNLRKDKMSNKLDKTNEDKHLACMFYINEISTDTQGLLEMINNRDKEDDWGQYIPQIRDGKRSTKEVFNELWAERKGTKMRKMLIIQEQTEANTFFIDSISFFGLSMIGFESKDYIILHVSSKSYAHRAILWDLKKDIEVKKAIKGQEQEFISYLNGFFVAEFIDMQKNDELISVFMLDKKGKDELLKLALQKLEKGKKWG